MEDLIKAAEALLTYIEEEAVCDMIDDDGDGQVYSQSHELRALTNDLQHAIEDAEPIRDAMKLIKKCFVTSVQTAMASQTQQP